MRKIICGVAVAFLAAFSFNTASAQPSGSDPMAECHKVFSEVGLIVRASPSSNGKKVGSLKKGQQVQLAGESLPGTGAVYPIMKKGSDPAYWIKLKAPVAGYVLYTSDDDLNYTYIVPCKK